MALLFLLIHAQKQRGNEAPWRKTVSREEIITAVKECAAKLGRAPRADEFQVTMSVQRHVIRKHFNSYAQLITECGLERRGSGVTLTMEEIFREWASVVRSTGKVPTALDYGRHGKYSHRPFAVRFKYWRKVPAGEMGSVGETEEGRTQGVL